MAGCGTPLHALMLRSNAAACRSAVRQAQLRFRNGTARALPLHWQGDTLKVGTGLGLAAREMRSSDQFTVTLLLPASGACSAAVLLGGSSKPPSGSNSNPAKACVALADVGYHTCPVQCAPVNAK